VAGSVAVADAVGETVEGADVAVALTVAAGSEGVAVTAGRVVLGAGVLGGTAPVTAQISAWPVPSATSVP